MTFDGHMRLGSLEVLAALAAFGVMTGRLRATGPQAASNTASIKTIALEVREVSGARKVDGALPLLVGRSPQADLPLTDAEVSRRHARFELHRGVVYVTDLKSSNGTFLNGERVTDSIEVRPGDHVDVGSTRLIYLAPEMAWK
ncbi:MAG: FHA domain-containing protein [Candidatus Eremiobacteraeota bacterium]|nr:FHA domain-containing protein [Candidatus Eremiobacteraeota bacterium]